jgi:hypothetical protein
MWICFKGGNSFDTKSFLNFKVLFNLFNILFKIKFDQTDITMIFTFTTKIIIFKQNFILKLSIITIDYCRN